MKARSVLITNVVPRPSHSELEEKNFVIANTFHQSYGSLLDLVSTVFKQSPLGKNFDETIECEWKYSFVYWYLT